jgi:hypothetical protein
VEDARRYEVVRLLDELMPTCRDAAEASVSFDVRLYLPRG